MQAIAPGKDPHLEQGRFDDWADTQEALWIFSDNIFECLRWHCPSSRFLEATRWLLAKGWNPLNANQFESSLIIVQRTPYQVGLPVMRLLMSKGIGVENVYHGTPFTPLYMALIHGRREYALCLIHAGARWPFSLNEPASTKFQSEMYDRYLAMGHCRLAQRATVRALTKRDARLRDVATHLIAAAIWKTRDDDEWLKGLR